MPRRTTFRTFSLAGVSDQAREILQDPYDLDFLALDPHHTERDLEDALTGRLTHFLAELGSGFAFVGRQYKLTVGRSDYFIDCWPEHGDGSTIGILLAADRDDVAVQYALRGLTTPVAISTYSTHRAQPDDVRPALPSVDELTELVRDVQHRHDE